MTGQTCISGWSLSYSSGTCAQSGTISVDASGGGGSGFAGSVTIKNDRKRSPVTPSPTRAPATPRFHDLGLVRLYIHFHLHPGIPGAVGISYLRWLRLYQRAGGDHYGPNRPIGRESTNCDSYPGRAACQCGASYSRHRDCWRQRLHQRACSRLHWRSWHRRSWNGQPGKYREN